MICYYTISLTFDSDTRIWDIEVPEATSLETIEEMLRKAHNHLKEEKEYYSIFGFSPETLP